MLSDPIKQFMKWFSEVEKLQEPTLDAMTLATVDKEGRPSARIVLFKGISGDGFRFFTNYHSRKGEELTANPHAALVFYWPTAYRQIRIEGKVELISQEESAKYFSERPYESQISAWVSEQSKQIENRDYLLSRYEKYCKQFPTDVPCPDYWGGYLLRPNRIEFWQGRDHRLHDRFVYTKKQSNWEMSQLAP